jgi:Rha family phage regulatory protein
MSIKVNQNHPGQLVFINGKQTTTNSQIVADYFSKRHSHVLRKIAELIEDCPADFTSAHFWAHAVNMQAGAVKRDSKVYEMTKDGFMFLVMGFTGKKAAELKIDFINAFNWMAKQLSGTVYKKTTTDERTPLRNAVNLLVSKKGLMYPDAYSMIHQRFNIDHLDQLDKAQLTQAVEYVHKLALDGEYLPAAKVEVLLPQQLNQYEIHNIKALCTHMEYLKKYFDQYKLYEVFTLLNSPAGTKMIDHIRDGFSFSVNVRRNMTEIEAKSPLKPLSI